MASSFHQEINHAVCAEVRQGQGHHQSIPQLCLSNKVQMCFNPGKLFSKKQPQHKVHLAAVDVQS